MLEASDNPENSAVGLVRSYLHDGHELLQVDLLRAKQEEGEAGTEGAASPREYSWYTCTDFYGMTVPLEVLEAMRIAEGASEAEWDRRGVESGEAGWGILYAWGMAEVASREATA
jgi:hypothetical protein